MQVHQISPGIPSLMSLLIKKGNYEITDVLCYLAGRLMSLPESEKFGLFLIFVLYKRQKYCTFLFWEKRKKKQFVIPSEVNKSAGEQGERHHHCQTKSS